MEMLTAQRRNNRSELANSTRPVAYFVCPRPI
jgi:hypothetical protein